MSKWNMTIDGIPVQVTQRQNCKRLILHARPDLPYATASVPKGLREADIRDMLERHREWLQTNVNPNLKPPTYAPGETHRLLGEWVTLGENGIPSGEEFVTMRKRQLMQVLRRQITQWGKYLHVGIACARLEDVRSRWGCCIRRRKELRFNTRLGCMPENLIECVVVHEVCHIIYGNHSPQFWKLVRRCQPDHKERKLALDKLDITPKVP